MVAGQYTSLPDLIRTLTGRRIRFVILPASSSPRSAARPISCSAG